MLGTAEPDEFPELASERWETREEMEAALQAYPPVNDAAPWDDSDAVILVPPAGAAMSIEDLRAFDAMMDADPGLYDNDDPLDVESVR